LLLTLCLSSLYLRAENVDLIYAFTNSLPKQIDGATPQPGLLLSTNGELYGATVNGGSNSSGALFILTTNGTLQPWHAFNYTPDGANPAAGVIRGSNGLFYGTTPLSGAASTNQGCVYQITAAGILTTLYSFPNLSRQTNSTGATPAGTLVQGTNGLFYGVTSAGGLRTNGTIFSVSASGQFTLRYTFTNGLDGGKPLAGLLLSSNGLFYGITSSGGSNGAGTIFKMTHAGAVTPLHSLTGAVDGTGATAPLVQTRAGLLVGAAAGGGSNSTGTIFQVTTNGAFSLLYTFGAKAPAYPFQNDDGATPKALLINAAGNYYGVASVGGTNGEGCVFEVTPAGDFRSVYAFTALSFGSPQTNAEGANPNGIVQAPDGSYYATAAHGGVAGFGTVFRISIPTPDVTVYFSGESGDLTYGNGTFQTLITNVPGSATVIIEGSTDFATWTPLFTNAPGAAQFQFSDDHAGDYPARFYRAIISP
jgi:uncharacterized repeat protein (TIGR03803 family)